MNKLQRNILKSIVKRKGSCSFITEDAGVSGTRECRDLCILASKCSVTYTNDISFIDAKELLKREDKYKEEHKLVKKLLRKYKSFRQGGDSYEKK